MQIIKPVDKIVGEDFLEGFVRPGLECVELEGKTWGVPISVGNHLMLLYNKNLIKEAPENTDEMVKIGKALTVDLDNDGVPDQYGLVYNLNEPFFFAPWLGGFGGWPLDGTTPTLNTKAMVDALQFAHDLKFVHRIVPVECDYDAADSLFKEGKAAMLINGDWSLAGYQTPEVKEKVDLGVARIPRISETGLWPAPMTSGIYFMIPDYVSGEKLQIAKEFIYGIENFLDVFRAPVLQNVTFLQLLLRTIVWTVVNVFFHVIGGLFLAILLNRPLRGKAIYRTLLTIPWAVPQVIAALAWKNEFHYQYGFVNAMLKRLGFTPIQRLSDPNYLRSSYLAVDDGQNPNLDKYYLPFGGNLLAESIRRLGGSGDR
jgi:hypothetical protein